MTNEQIDNLQKRILDRLNARQVQERKKFTDLQESENNDMVYEGEGYEWTADSFKEAMKIVTEEFAKSLAVVTA